MRERATKPSSVPAKGGPAKRSAEPAAPAHPAAAPDSVELPFGLDLEGLSLEGASAARVYDEPEGGSRPSTPGQLLALQRKVGNRAVSGFIRSVAQRVPVSANTSETLYNQTNAAGQATARHYGGPKSFEMTRQGDSGVTVTVKIKFVNQARNTTPPGAPGAPRLGQLVGSPTAIAPGDARRAWATDMMTQAVGHWNGHLTFVGEEVNIFSANTQKRLPVTFRAVPVWGLGESANTTVVLHGPATTAGTPGHPIDAGNFYMNKNDRYPANDDVIYAHEYGHLIGIPDEYSQSNEQMNALLHQAAPGNAASSLAALDRSTVERMALAAMAQPLYNQLSSAMPTVSDAINAQGDVVRAKMAEAARGGVVDPAVRAQLQSVLESESAPGLSSRIPEVVAFQSTTNFSNVTRATEGVAASFNPAAISSQVLSLYWRALNAPHGQNVAVAGLGDVRINVQSAVRSSTASGTALAGNATALATSTVGPSAAPAGGGGAPGGGGPALPAIPPPTSLVGQISALPATWAAAGSTLEAGVTPAAFATKLQAILPNAAVAALGAAIAGLPGGSGPSVGTHGQLYRRAYELLNNAATEAATQLAAELIETAVNPVLQSSVTSLQTAISSEAANVMTMGPAALAAAGNPNPNMRAIVSGMKARLDADKAATAGTGRDPLGAAGGTAPAQDVTYSYQGLMGSNASTEIRSDQFAPMLQQFNARLTNIWERDFRAETS